jgi:outer membrane protein assembly factor BamB
MTICLRLALCLAAALAPSPALGAPDSDWPRFRGPRADGTSPETGINKDWRARPPRLVWKAALGDDGYAGPSAANGLVYIMDHEGSRDVVRALRFADGTEAWRFPYEETSQNVYGFSRATPTVDEGRVYTISRSGRLHCLGAADGKPLWSRDLVKDFGGRPPMWRFASSALVDGRKLIVWPGAPDASVVALDKVTGQVLWRGGGGDISGYGTPVAATLAGRKQYAMTVWKGFVGVDAQTGRLLWRVPWETRDGTNVASPVVIGDSVFLTSSYDMGCALADVGPGGARIRWQNKEMQAHVSTPVLYGGHLYGTSDPGGYLVCLDPQTGRAMWKQRGFEKGGVVALDGVLIAVGGANGDVVMVKAAPEGYQELGRITPLGGQSWTAPIVARGKLLVRNRAAMVCLDLR